MRSAVGGLVSGERRGREGAGWTHLEAGDAALTKRHRIYMYKSPKRVGEEEKGSDASEVEATGFIFGHSAESAGGRKFGQVRHAP